MPACRLCEQCWCCASALLAALALAEHLRWILPPCPTGVASCWQCSAQKKTLGQINSSCSQVRVPGFVHAYERTVKQWQCLSSLL